MYTTADGKKIYSTENLHTPEEIADIVIKQQEKDHAFSLQFGGDIKRAPNKNKPAEVVEFPKKEETGEGKNERAA